MNFKRCIVIIIIFIVGLFFNLPAGAVDNIIPLPQDSSTFLGKIDTTIWKYLKAKDRSKWQINKEDSVRAYKEYFYEGYKIYIKANKIFDRIKKGRTTYQEQTERLIQLLEPVRDLFEKGIRLNPFDDGLRKGLRVVYTYLDGLYGLKKQDEKRVQILLNMLIYEQNRKRKINHYYNLGFILYNHGLYDLAEQNCQKSIDYIFEGDESEIDSLKLFNNLFICGQSQLKQGKGELALTSLTYAKMIVPNEKLEKQIQQQIDYIAWDDGNVAASKSYSDALTLARQKKYEEAEKEYLRTLDIVKTLRARRETQLQLARLQFYQLGKKMEGINRLWIVVQILQLQSDSSTTIDSSQVKYWNRYAQMCFSLASENYNKDSKTAFTYFYKISQFENPLQARAYYYLATLARMNPDICLNYCKKAYSDFDKLNKSEKKGLYKLLYDANLVKGNFAEALHWFKKWFYLKNS